MRFTFASTDRTELTDRAKWAGVFARDARLDGRYFYAVTTTGVFCRPSCGARRPRRQNVRFFATTDDATSAGFRACKRCKPTEIDSTVKLFEQVRALVDRSGDVPMTLDALARETGATPTRVHRTFKRATGMSPKEYQDARRGERLRNELRAGHSVSRATVEAGYGSTSRLHHRAGDVLGMTPKTFRDRGKGMHIQFGTTSTPLGDLLVAFTERGVCSVALGDDSRALEADLRAQFSAAEIEPATSKTKAKIDSVVAAMHGADVSVPLDVSGTDFQLLVWRALQRIPRGETRSYSAIAASVGKPLATRAVARACAQNQLAVVIPCHRVIREDGELGGYRWGMERKRRLLDQESSTSKP
jgi:AraC family transcriptional regulator, regulatory protein of adaptative response / methylated-DNA-[protein]-cysteine methyltransferase